MFPLAPRAASSWLLPLSQRGLGYYGMNGMAHAPTSSSHGFKETIYATTILSVRKNGIVAMVGDGQVTQGSQVMKPNARKVRRIGASSSVIIGFAGATADAFTLMTRLETKIEAYPSQLSRACVELAKDWRTEKYLRQLEATMIVVDKDVSLMVTGLGDVIEPPDGIMAIGSGGGFALAAAKALYSSNLTPMEICLRSMAIAAEMCVYTNSNFVCDQLPLPEAAEAAAGTGSPSASPTEVVFPKA